MPGQLVVVLKGESLAVTGVEVSATQAADGPGRVDAKGAVYGALLEAGFAVLSVRPPHGPRVSWVGANGEPCDPPGDAPEWVEIIGNKVGRSLTVLMQRDEAGVWTCESATTAGELTTEDLEGFRRDVASELQRAGKGVRL